MFIEKVYLAHSPPVRDPVACGCSPGLGGFSGDVWPAQPGRVTVRASANQVPILAGQRWVVAGQDPPAEHPDAQGSGGVLRHLISEMPPLVPRAPGWSRLVCALAWQS